MRNFSAVVIFLAMVTCFSSAWAEEFIPIKKLLQDEALLNHDSMIQNLPCDLFTGVSLTKPQRQQIRDLMQLIRDKQPLFNISDIEKMYNLVTADKFDEAAARALAKKSERTWVNWQVEIGRIRHQIYHLLSPEQRAVLKKQHQQCMDLLHSQMPRTVNKATRGK